MALRGLGDSLRASGACGGSCRRGVCAPFLPFSLAFASGAMLYVVSDELIPESHSHGHEYEVTLGYVSGFLIVLTVSRLLTALG